WVSGVRGRKGFVVENTRRRRSVPSDAMAVLSNVGLADAVIGDDRSLERADDYTRQALAACPPECLCDVKANRGIVLIARGQPDDGIRLIEEALEQDEPRPHTTAEYLCLLSVGEVKRGDVSRAVSCRDTARKLDQRCVFLPMANAAIAATT